MTIKVFSGLVAVLFGSFMVHDAYLHVNGYPAAKVERDLCKGHHLVEQDVGDTTLLACSRTKVGDPIQLALRQHKIDPRKMFMLAEMRPLCKKANEEPRDMGGELGCMPKERKMATN